MWTEKYKTQKKSKRQIYTEKKQEKSKTRAHRKEKLESIKKKSDPCLSLLNLGPLAHMPQQSPQASWASSQC